MFGLFDAVADAVENVVDVGVGVISLGEYGKVNKKTVSKMVADGIEIAIIAHELGVAEEIIVGLLDE